MTIRIPSPHLLRPPLRPPLRAPHAVFLVGAEGARARERQVADQVVEAGGGRGERGAGRAVVWVLPDGVAGAGEEEVGARWKMSMER